ncbi:hypothetical protein [Undibacterium griseum]|uniref:Uncharacterized protein n=1 Tax=Undibacterium griseum TaxID=2762295 RepID=A0ABR6YMV5_9BURK|nr:hypothetical protein [Undibacterium griseum]MBC3885230.1 hypothetical protein [Undibacterium griseum]
MRLASSLKQKSPDATVFGRGEPVFPLSGSLAINAVTLSGEKKGRLRALSKIPFILGMFEDDLMTPTSQLHLTEEYQCGAIDFL